MSFQDIGVPPPNHKWNVTLEKEESPEELTARLELERLDANTARKQEWIIFCVCLAIVVIVGVLGLWLLLAGANADAQRYGSLIVTAILSGAVSFLAGRKSAKNNK